MILLIYVLRLFMLNTPEEEKVRKINFLSVAWTTVNSDESGDKDDQKMI